MLSRRFIGAVCAVTAALVLAGAASAATITRDVAGYDWTLPAWAAPAPNSGFFSEADSAAGDRRLLRGFDLTWRQLQPAGPGTFSLDTTGSAEGMALPSFRSQDADPSPFWMRLFVSGTSWAPPWLAQKCAYRSVGPDYEGRRHVPIWNPCVWSHVRAVWRELLVGRGLRADPRLRFVYVPGGFTWSEFDYDMVDAGVRQNGLTFSRYSAWHRQMVADLVAMMNGDNADPSDDFAYKLVFTGEDYPFSETFGDDVALFARDAVDAGMGIRTGITEVANFHLGEVPAYGTRIASSGHMVTDESRPLLTDRRRIAATENECYTDCGFTTPTPAHSVRTSNLKALQLRMNWIYVFPEDSYLKAYAAHWAWVRLELGRRAADAPDAWIALRDAEDTYWKDRGDRTWTGFPYVRNFERWVVQRDVAGRGVPRRGTIVFTGDPAPENGRAYESLRTNVAAGQDGIHLAVDDRFLTAARPQAVDAKVTFKDVAGTAFRVEYRATGGATRTTPPVTGAGSNRLRTVTFRLPDAAFDNGLGGATDLVIRALDGDAEVAFFRVVKTVAPPSF
ncbi:MAG TPA: hypothetical protein VF533_08450 [Solirubrobacteraceae bacterium]